MNQLQSVAREWLDARDIIAAVFFEVAPSYGKERCEHFAACTLARLANAGILTIRYEDYPAEKITLIEIDPDAGILAAWETRDDKEQACMEAMNNPGSIRENLDALRAAAGEYDPSILIDEFEAVVAAERKGR